MTTVRVASESEVEEGGMKCIEIKGKEILIARVRGQLFAIDAICNHGLAYLEEGSIEDFNIVCPLHGGGFDLRTGTPTREPACEPLRTYAVRGEAGDILIEVEES